MNTSKTNKQRVLEYLKQVGAQGATNAQIKKQTRIPSHQQVHLLTRELARKKEITAQKKGGKWIFVLADSPSPAAFEGEWLVVSSPDFNQEYLKTATTPYVCIKADGYAFSGTFEIGLISGDFAGRLDGERVLFSFEAMDELELVHGAGIISLQDDLLIFKLLYYAGDEWTFICKRSISE
jgi:hypothetical protein